jgi:pSer/pThr/pTyr-binding forkhead associated (FHA) protein
MIDDHEESRTRLVSSAFTGSAESPEPRIIAINGPIKGAAFELEAEATRIGRRRDNEIQLSVAGVSKLHCVIENDGSGNFYITDRNSTNGTEVNGRRLKPETRQQLTDGDTIAILDSTFFFLNPAGAAAAEPEEIKVDFESALDEARGVLEDSDEFLALREARKKRRRRG